MISIISNQTENWDKLSESQILCSWSAAAELFLNVFESLLDISNAADLWKI